MPDGTPWRRIAFAALALAIGATCLAFLHDMRDLRARLFAGSEIIETRHGAVEVARAGDGPAILALHGAGGGYDQGLLLADTFAGDQFCWIAPSRFGYLRSTLPKGGSTEAQADALADMLDALGVERVAILAMSGGVPPALQFAIRHPGRVSALALLSSAPFTPFTAKEQDLPIPIWLYQALFSSDFPFWLLVKSARPVLHSAFDVKPEMRTGLPHDEAAFVAAMIDGFLPVTARIAGVGNEGAAIDPAIQYLIERIDAPTLVIHARDDGINPFAIGEAIAGRIPDSGLIALPAGGHLLLGHHVAVRESVTMFLRAHATSGKENCSAPLPS